MAHIFDNRAGVREKLFLLSVLTDPNDSANWAYDPKRDVWDHVSGKAKAVRWEASYSLTALKQRGIDRNTAMEMIGNREAA